eukprot:gene14691-biopygen10906
MHFRVELGSADTQHGAWTECASVHGRVGWDLVGSGWDHQEGAEFRITDQSPTLPIQWSAIADRIADERLYSQAGNYRQGSGMPPGRGAESHASGVE